jgi:hypothetical protein
MCETGIGIDVAVKRRGVRMTGLGRRALAAAGSIIHLLLRQNLRRTPDLELSR